jgi:hypothetical protein
MQTSWKISLMALKNTWLLKVSNFFFRKYPTKIVPKPNFRVSLDIDDLLKTYDLHFVRKSNLPKNKSFNTAGKLKSEAIDLERIPYLSSNLLGKYYQIKHLAFMAFGSGAMIWKGQEINIWNFYADYKYDDDYDPIIIPVNSLHRTPVPFKAPNDKANRQRFKLPFEPNVTLLELEGESSIIHSPTILNYWHVELEIIDADSKPIKKSKGAFNSFACEFLSDIISEVAISKHLDVEIIEDTYFIN